MLRIKAIKTVANLNCSANGVLYHYTDSMENVESIVTNGLKASPYSPRRGADEDEYLAGVAFSRSKTNTPYTGLTGVDDSGSEFQRWKYGVIFSKDKLSNLGKISPYHWAANVEATGLNLYVRHLEPRNLKSLDGWEPDAIELSIGVTLDKHSTLKGGCQVNAKFYYPEGTAAAADADGLPEEIALEKSPLPKKFKDAESEYNHYVQILSDMGLKREVPIDNAAISVTIFKTKIDTSSISSLPELLRNIMLQVMQAAKKEIKKKQIAQGREQSGEQLIAKVEGLEPVYFSAQGETSYEAFLAAIKELQKKAPEIRCRQDGDTWHIYGSLPDNMTFKDLPKILQILVSRSGLFEAEDRLIIPKAKPGDYITETKDAILGIIVPRQEYYSHEVEAFRSKFPNIPVYAYAEKNASPEDARNIPREAYGTPET